MPGSTVGTLDSSYSELATEVKSDVILPTIGTNDSFGSKCVKGTKVILLYMLFCHPSRDFSLNLKQDLSGLSGFFKRLRSKSCFKMSGLSSFWTVYLKKPLKNRARLNGFERFIQKICILQIIEVTICLVNRKSQREVQFKVCLWG